MTEQSRFGEGPQKRTLFADFAVIKFAPVMQWLKKDGIYIDTVTEAELFVLKIASESFDVVVVNLLLGGVGPFELIEKVRAKSRNPDVKIIVISRQVQKLNIQNAIRAGANDFVADPFDNENLYHRVLYHLAPKKVISVGDYQGAVAHVENWPYINLMLEATELLSRTPRSGEHETFMKILKDMAALVQSNRTSLIIVEGENNTGLVLATSDDPTFKDFPISLHKYPEILHVMHTGDFVLIENVNKNLSTMSISDKVRTIEIGSLMVFPVRFGDEVTGVLSCRRPKAVEVPSADVMRVLQAIANTLAAQANFRAKLRKVYQSNVAKAG